MEQITLPAGNAITTNAKEPANDYISFNVTLFDIIILSNFANSSLTLSVGTNMVLEVI